MPSESTGNNDSSSIVEQMRKEMRSRVKQARNNPITRDRLQQLEEQFNKLYKNFIGRGVQDQGDIEEDIKLVTELKEHCAVADNLVEFRMVLEEVFSNISEQYRKKVVEDILSHENAHVNSGEASGHKFDGYAVLFIQSQFSIETTQPFCVIDPDPSWGAREFLERHLYVTIAPATYGNRLSFGDERNLSVYLAELKELDEKEQRAKQIITFKNQSSEK